MFYFSSRSGKLERSEIEMLLHKRWLLLARYYYSNDNVRYKKDLKLYNKLVLKCEKLHYHGVSFSSKPIRNYDVSPNYQQPFYIKNDNHTLTVSGELENGERIVLLIATYSNDNVIISKLYPNSEYLANNTITIKQVDAILENYNQKRPANPYCIFYFAQNIKSKEITSRYPNQYNDLLTGFCNRYKSFQVDYFTFNYGDRIQKLLYNKKLYNQNNVTVNQLSVITGIHYYTIKNWVDHNLSMEFITFGNFVKISAALNGATTCYNKFMIPYVDTKFNVSFKNLSLAEIRSYIQATQDIFSAILGVTRKHYNEIEKNPYLMMKRSAQAIFDLATFCNCRVVQLFPKNLILSYQALP